MSGIEYRVYEGMPDDAVLGWIVTMSVELFSFGGDVTELKSSLLGKEQIHTVVALDTGQPVGFKIGYKQRPHYFESWMGGVMPDARRRGIADELQHRQHAWCVEQGFRIVTTITSGDNAPMLILNLRHGYTVVGTFLDRGKHLKVILQKRLEHEDC